MKAQISAHATGALLFFSLVTANPLAMAGGSSACDDIAKDVSEAVSKDPAKVLMIVEDALVINETCACEVVKAAILGANADKATVQQIVQTALAVAPKMSAVISECANAVSPGSADSLAATVAAEETSGGKGAKNVLPPSQSAETEGSDFGAAWATNIRGIYLVQPAAAGFVTTTGDSEDDQGDGKKSGKGGDGADDDDDTSNRANSRRTRNLVALSPAKAVP